MPKPHRFISLVLIVGLVSNLFSSGTSLTFLNLESDSSDGINSRGQMGTAFNSSSSETMDGYDKSSYYASSSSSGTVVGGHITTNTTWTLANSPYIVTSDVIVESGVTLTIEPGVAVKFTSGKSLIICGILVARGTPTSKITFTSNATMPRKGDWGGIKFRDPSPDNASVLAWVTVAYGR